MTRLGTLILALALGAPAFGQLPPPPPPKPAGQPELTPTQRMITAPSGKQVIFETMATPGPDGKIARLDIPTDIASLQRNPLIDAATRERLRAAVADWVSDVDLVAIENLDFLERIEPADGSPGVVAVLDSASIDQTKFIGQMVTQLGAAGNLNNVLNGRGLLTADQFNINQHITAEYLQRCMNEVIPANQVVKDQAEQLDRTNRYNRFLYTVSVSDATCSYHRLLAHTGAKLPELVATLKLDTAKLADALAKAKSAADDAGRRAAATAALRQLSFTQRQDLLRAAQKASPPFDPFPGQTSAQSNPPAKTGG